MDAAHESFMNTILPGDDQFSFSLRFIERALWDNDIIVANLVLLPANFIQAYWLLDQPEFTWSAFQYYVDDFNRMQQANVA